MHYQMHQKEYPEFVKNLQTTAEKKKTNQKNQRRTTSKADQHPD